MGPTVWACLVSAALAAEPATEPGLVAEQPTSGRFVKTERGFMVPYRTRIPGSRVEFEMQPIPGGVFRLGSPHSEAGRDADEGPQVDVTVPPFWLGACEVTWGEYKRYMATQRLLRELRREGQGKLQPFAKVDVFTAPSALYDELTVFEFGEEADRPAIMLKQYAAKQYTKWLSGLVGAFYRLPTEAEWEYACRAGATTAFSFGDDAGKLDEYGWFADNSAEKTQRVRQKRPNAWGLFDMHGNVAEWTLDEFFADHYAELARAGKVTTDDAWQRPKIASPRVIRGGSWDDAATKCRSAARLGSDDAAWSREDPFLPQSPWWYTGGYARGVGFRVLRPLDPPAAELRERYWGADSREQQRAVDEYIDDNGRGERGVANEAFRKQVEQRRLDDVPRR